ncbi:MAG: DNA primase [Treponemataceae bacterium]
MRRISHKTIDEINQRADFPSLVGEYTQLERRGSEFWCRCPFHTDKTPSFHIRPDVKMYKCFSCGRGGSIINFYTEIEKISFVEAVERLAKKNGIEIVYEGNIAYIPEENNKHDEYVELYNRLADTYKFFLNDTEMGKIALDYLMSRGVSKEMIEKFKIGYSPADGKWLKTFLKSKHYSDEFLSNTGLFSKKYPDFSFFRDRLMFPIFDRRGDVVAFSARFLRGDASAAKTGKYINTPETVWYKKSEILFGFNFAKDAMRVSKKVIICEGNLDVIAFHQAGIMNAVASCGTALTENHVKILSSFVDTVYLSFDLDEAGINAAIKAITLCRKADLTVKVLKLEGGKDPSEIFQKLGKEQLTYAIKCAILDADFLFSILAKRYDIGTPDGKKRAAEAFFSYVHSLKSEMQKSASLEQLSRAYNLNLEAVTRDFYNSQNENFKKNNSVSDVNYCNDNRVRMNAQIRAMLAVISNMKYFSKVRSLLTVDDFDDVLARDMFIALEECYREGSDSFDSFIARCTDDRVKKIAIDSITNGEFTSNSEQVVADCIKLIKKLSLTRKRERLQNQLRQCSTSTLEEKQTAENLLNEVMGIDLELRKFTKKDAIG